jgi:hypothetical protein
MAGKHARARSTGAGRTLLAVAAGASASVVPGVAHADAPDLAAPAPQPYGGQLGQEAGSAPTLDPTEAGLLGLGVLNGVGVIAAGVLDAFRGPSPEETRRALMARSGPGTVSERRARRVVRMNVREQGAHRLGHLRTA